MDCKLLFISSVSACFELNNSAPYYADSPYTVLVNGEKVIENGTTNIFSLFDLEPDTDYEVSVGEYSTMIHTKAESACLSVEDFGAVGDGVNDDTQAVQSAIDVCPENGRVVVEEGTYMVGPIQLKSHMTLELKKGAVLLGDTDQDHYPVLPGELEDPVSHKDIEISTFEGAPARTHKSFVSAYFAKDITITGEGTIDGNAQNAGWWINPKSQPYARPRLCFLNRCEDVVIHGITGQNSPSWNFHPFFSKNVSFLDMKVRAPKVSPNTDGSDPESCDNVKYIGCVFSVGDDAIAIKSGKMYMGMKYKTPATNHVIRNCLMEYAHGAVVLGSEMSAGVRDLTVSQCLFKETDRGLRIKTRRGRGKYSVVDGVQFSNIKMENVKVPLVINMYYDCDPDGKDAYVQNKAPELVDERTPYLGRFTFRDMECRDCEWAAGFFYGLPEMPIESITIDHVSFTFKEEAEAGLPAMMQDIEETHKKGLCLNNVNTLILRDVHMEGQDGDMIEAINVQEIDDGSCQ